MRLLYGDASKREIQKGRDGGKICNKCFADKQGIFTEKNNATPTWRDAQGAVRYDIPDVLSLISRLPKSY